MPEYLRAMAVILGLAAVVFAIARRPAAVVMGDAEFKRRRDLWIALTLIAFLSRNIWIYMVVAGVLLWVAAGRESNRQALFYFLLFAVPPAPAVIPGFGGINYLFSIDHLRLLSLAVLLPTCLKLHAESEVGPFGKLACDRYVGAYLIFLFALQLNATTFTDALRNLFYVVTDILLPYYAASRSMRGIEEFRDALMAFVVACLVLVPIAVFELAKHWLLYVALINAQGVDWAMAGYLLRGGSLRAQASAGQPIALGYVMAVAAGLHAFLRTSLPPVIWHLGMLALIAGMIAPQSRGPWVGALAIAVTFVLSGPKPFQHLLLGIFGALLALPVLLASPVGDKVVDRLPFVGTLDAGNVEYRELLFDTSLKIIGRHPWFGDHDYMHDPAMQVLMQGQGIIDVVNTYLEVALANGVVGLALFVAVFVSLLIAIAAGIRHLPSDADEPRLLGRTLLAVLVGILITIATVSSVTVIPIVYWSVAGLGAAYVRLAAEARKTVTESPVRESSLRRPVMS